MTIVVVGAGVAGLTAARRLVRHHRSVTLLDKGRSVGGRLATRRLDERGDHLADHGAQFFTVRSAEFAALVDGWPVRPWHHGPARARTITDPPDTVREGGDGHPRFIGRRGMNAVAKSLAQGLDVRVDTRVTRIRPTHEGRSWVIELDGDRPLLADAVLVTAPVPQAIELLDEVPVPDDVAALSYAPCLALLAQVDARRSGVPGQGALQLDEGPVRWVADNGTKGIAELPTLTVHAADDWSAAHWDDEDATIEAALRELVKPWLDGPIGPAQVKRWRYATPTNPHAQRAVEVAPGLVLAGDAFGGPKVEGAALSGLAAADILLG